MSKVQKGLDDLTPEQKVSALELHVKQLYGELESKKVRERLHIIAKFIDQGKDADVAVSECKQVMTYLYNGE